MGNPTHGGTRPGAGRPKGSLKGRETFRPVTVSISESECEALTELCKESGLTRRQVLMVGVKSLKNTGASNE